jgi:hypothetical protein
VATGRARNAAYELFLHGIMALVKGCSSRG